MTNQSFLRFSRTYAREKGLSVDPDRGWVGRALRDRLLIEIHTHMLRHEPSMRGTRETLKSRAAAAAAAYGGTQ